jgi:hypothetical protein
VSLKRPSGSTLRRRESNLERTPVSRSRGKPFGGSESMGMSFPGGSWVKSLPREVSLERPSGSMLRRRERKLSQQERGIMLMKNCRRSKIVSQLTINIDSGGSSSCCYSPPNVDRLDVAGGLNPGLSAPGN